MKLEAKYAVPLYLALDRNELGNSIESFDAFMINDETMLHMKKWLLYCCQCIEDTMVASIRDKAIEARICISEQLNHPVFPRIQPLAGNVVPTPFGILFLARMCIGEKTSEFQSTASGGYMVFNGILSSTLHNLQCRKFFIDTLYDSFEQE